MEKVVIYHVTGVRDRNREPYEALVVNPEGDIRGYIFRPDEIIHLEVHKLEFEVDWPLMPRNTVFVKELIV